MNVAGSMLLAALLLATFIHPAWMWLAALPCFGLFLDALTGLCPMRAILRSAPWNRPSPQRAN